MKLSMLINTFAACWFVWIMVREYEAGHLSKSFSEIHELYRQGKHPPSLPKRVYAVVALWAVGYYLDSHGL
jgi:hypothetical protein